MGLFRRGTTISEKDGLVFDVDKWIEKSGNLIRERNIFVKLDETLSKEVVFAEMSLFENS